MDVASSKPGYTKRVTRLFTSRTVMQAFGFTLVELLVTLAIASILAAYALPAYTDFSNRQRQITHVNTLVSSLYLARNEAINRNRDVMICKSADGQSCTTQGEWDQGWLVFEDRDSNRSLDDDDELFLSQPGLPNVAIYYRGFGSTNYIVYNARGVTNTNGTFVFCDAGGAPAARALIIAKTGRPRTSFTRSDGSPLACPP